MPETNQDRPTTDIRPNLRKDIRSEIARIDPLDELERTTQSAVLAWVDSGVELCRLRKPDVPPQHLIAYFVVVDGEHLLLVDHINAELWLPTGGHVEPDEHPRTTVLREAREELSIDGEFLAQEPLFLTRTRTVGKTAGHTDVSLWYLLRGDRTFDLVFDQTEFLRVRWFHKDAIPHDRTDPNMARFLLKLYGN